MTFTTMYSKKKPGAASTSGEKLEPEYEMQIEACGHKHLIDSGRKIDIYSKIQESLEETKIENIIRRAMAGDETAINTMNGQYIDTQAMPTSLAEMLNLTIQAEQEFNKLPLEIRANFDHSTEKYIMMMGTPEWVENMTTNKEKEKQANIEKIKKLEEAEKIEP
ncbi:internal scaffolding protein [Sigmofec virus UA08Rod_4967]|uniref:Internal scaffolding protein n=1 Tax=Sigmofec virus UA08Rod_4967 TaxID=2929413 RepID=A0A976N1M1_9VIRU|nr:internal scaffolding protein [Sigmofec virus UA08Rod_4967]